MQKARPDAILIQAPVEGSCACNECPYMKLNTLEKIRDTLKTLNPTVTVDPAVARLARIGLQRMMDITDVKTVTSPTRFDAPSPAL